MSPSMILSRHLPCTPQSAPRPTSQGLQASGLKLHPSPKSPPSKWGPPLAFILYTLQTCPTHPRTRDPVSSGARHLVALHPGYACGIQCVVSGAEESFADCMIFGDLWACACVNVCVPVWMLTDSWMMDTPLCIPACILASAFAPSPFTHGVAHFVCNAVVHPVHVCMHPPLLDDVRLSFLCSYGESRIHSIKDIVGDCLNSRSI